MDACGAGTEESLSFAASYDALIHARYVVDASHSLDDRSVCQHDYRNEPPFPLLGWPASPLGTADQVLDSTAAYMNTNYGSSLVNEVFQYSEAWASGIPCPPDLTASNDSGLYTLFVHDGEVPTRQNKCYDFEPFPDLQCSSMGMSSQFEFSPIDALPQISSSCSSGADSIERIVRDRQCDWPQCSKIGLPNAEQHKTHLKQHAEEVSDKWAKGQKCAWPNCSSKASHRSRKLFEAHLNNIHVNPLMCTVKGCRHKTPFRANHDLRRHIATAHNAHAPYKCPYMSCGSIGREFIRRDKWLSHVKEQHETEPCPYTHCQTRPEHVSLLCQSSSKHIGKAHGKFECALKSCNGRVSQFSEIQLMEHLELHHGMEWGLVLKMKDIVKAAPDYTLRPDHVQEVEVGDCRICG